MRKLSLVSVLLLVACAGKPIYYGPGVKWTVPMVSPMEAEPVVVPVMIQGKGPYLFLLDPGEPQSGIDQDLGISLKLFSNASRQRLRENDTKVPSPLLEVIKMQVGDLIINKSVLYAIPRGALQVRGQRIHGYLGWELLSDTVSIEIDRDRGVVTLALSGQENAMPGAQVIKGYFYLGNLRVPVHTANGTKLDMIVDLGAKLSAVWPALMHKLGWALIPGRELTIDSTGHHTILLGRTEGKNLIMGAGTRLDGVEVTAFADKRYRERTVDGHIGQNVLSRYNVLFNRDKRVVLLSNRDDDLGARVQDRIARWGDTFKGCQTKGCATLALIRAKIVGGESKLVVIIDAAARAQATELFLQGVDANNQAVSGPLLRLTVSQGLPQVTLGVPDLGDLRKATAFRVVDITPFPPACATTTCLVPINN